MFVNYNLLKQKIVGRGVEKPTGGTLSGHAAGEPFDKLVNQLIKEQFPNCTYRQYEYLNFLFSKNKDAKTVQARNNLFESPTLLFLLDRGKNAVEKWSVNNLFEEKQNDTADILVTKEKKFELIDVKTRNLGKKAQAPNIISAYKLAQTCAKMIDNQDFDLFDINYFQVDWRLDEKLLVCLDAHYAELFKCPPEELYINWAAAMQIQFHVDELNQNFNNETRETWARRYLKHFTTEAKRRANYMIEEFVKPFEKYLR
ncbi:MAG: HincII family type II restriction endonuclease [Fibrobacter sp.]|nr:HincII family type II restriction endonuclease [Fibrobacter sp.]